VVLFLVVLLLGGVSGGGRGAAGVLQAGGRCAVSLAGSSCCGCLVAAEGKEVVERQVMHGRRSRLMMVPAGLASCEKLVPYTSCQACYMVNVCLKDLTHIVIVCCQR